MLDTRNKRSSSIGLDLAPLLILPDTVDREALAYVYSGIPSSSTPSIGINTYPPTIEIHKPAKDVIVTVPGRFIKVQTNNPSIVSDVVVRG